jgi:hypothetical protein
MAYGTLSAVADAAKEFAIDLISGSIFSRNKTTWGGEGVANEVTSAAGLPVALDTPAAAAIGATSETAPASDTATAGLNGRLQRIAQRLTALIALVPAALANGRFKIALRDASDADLGVTANPLRTIGTGTAALATAQASVTTTPGVIVAARAGRESVTIEQLGTTAVWIGPTGVSPTNGALLPGVVGASITLPTAAAIFAVTAAGSQSVSVIELY